MDIYALVLDVLSESESTVIQAWPEMQVLLRRAAARQPRDWRLPALACEAVGGKPEEAASAAAAIACAQISIILIDDLLDADPRGEYQAIGAPAAANLAAAFQAAALEIIAEKDRVRDPAAGLSAWRSLNQMMLTTAFGQRLDIQNPADEAAYWKVVESKSAPFYSATLQVGAILGGASIEVGEKFRQLGCLYGEMIQIHDDLNDAMAVPANPDWAQGRSSLPILFAQTVDYPERQRFVELRRALQIAPDIEMLAEAQAILIRSGAVSYCVYELLRRHHLAQALLATLAVDHRAAIESLFEDLVRPVRRLFAAMGKPQAELFSTAEFVLPGQ